MNLPRLTAEGTQGSQVAAPCIEVSSLPQGEQADAPDDAKKLAGHRGQSDGGLALKDAEDVPGGQGVLRGEPAGQYAPARQAWHVLMDMALLNGE